MRVQFVDGRTGELLWVVNDTPAAPRVGEQVVFPSGRGVAVVGVVWDYDGHGLESVRVVVR